VKKVILTGAALLSLTACGYAPTEGLAGTDAQSVQAQRMSTSACNQLLQRERKIFEQSDRDRDRRVSYAEAYRSPLSNYYNFSSLDRNEDGYVSESEFIQQAKFNLCGDDF
jgi:Ca2+-binding EF-hand superfamily protein